MAYKWCNEMELKDIKTAYNEAVIEEGNVHVALDDAFLTGADWLINQARDEVNIWENRLKELKLALIERGCLPQTV